MRQTDSRKSLPPALAKKGLLQFAVLFGVGQAAKSEEEQDELLHI